MKNFRDAPTDINKRLTPKEPTAFGFVPATKFRFSPTKLGHLCEVNAKGDIVGEWAVDDNAAVVKAMNGQTVYIPRGYVKIAQALLDVGAHSMVHHRHTEAYDLAFYGIGDTGYL